jgi:DNA-binding NtrC family response regulator
LLVKYFLDRSTRQHSRTLLTVQSDALRALDQYNWPGDVRELENLVQRVGVACPHSTIHATDFFGNQATLRGTNGDLNSVSKAARQTAERERILQALSETQGDKTRAARLLKISRSNLYNKLRTYQIS